MKLIIDTKKDSREEILKAVKFLESIVNLNSDNASLPVQSSQVVQSAQQDSFSGLAGFDMFSASPQQNISPSVISIPTQPADIMEAKQSAEVVPIDNVMMDIFAGAGISDASAEVKSTDEKLPKTKVI